jgi:hypothetical protein
MHCCDPAIGRQLHSDDVAWSSFRYPEGSIRSGPGALQPGDIAFDQRYSVIRGQVRNADNLPIAGALVTAEDLQGRPIASAIGGRVQASGGGGLPFQYLPPSLGGLADGDYALPVPKGIYRVAVEPNDGWPERSYGSNESGFAGFLFGNILAVNRGRGLLLQAALFGTFPVYTWEIARFDAAMITTGHVAADGQVTIDLAHPLVRRAPFVGADADLAPLYVEHSLTLGLYAEKVLPILGKDLFVVLALSKDSVDPDFPPFSRYGVMGDLATPGNPARGTSFYSGDGGKSWFTEDFGDYSFGLVVAPR